jgi:hypothetical protein
MLQKKTQILFDKLIAIMLVPFALAYWLYLEWYHKKHKK